MRTGVDITDIDANRCDRTDGVVYASSIAVYGSAPKPMIEPDTLYGVSKVAVERIAEILYVESGLRSIGLRPYVVYGPGRDVGMTPGLTAAVQRAVAGDESHLTFGGDFQLHYARDVADDFLFAAGQLTEGAMVDDLGGESVSMSDVVSAIHAAVREFDGRITFDDVQLPFPTAVPSVVFDFPPTS